MKPKSPLPASGFSQQTTIPEAPGTDRIARLVSQELDTGTGLVRDILTVLTGIAAPRITSPLPLSPSGYIDFNFLTQLLVANDGTRNRVQIGNLLAYTDPTGVSSPAGPGLRVLDANGNIIFDSVGVAQVARLLASVGADNWAGAAVLIGSNGPPFGISGSGGEIEIVNLPFTLARRSSVLLIGTAFAGAWVSAAGPLFFVEPIYLRVDGQVNSAAAGVSNSNASGSTLALGALVTQPLVGLPAGNYTARLFWNPNAARDRLDVFQQRLFCYLLGG